MVTTDRPGMMLWRALVLALAVAAVCVASSTAATSDARYYVPQNKVADMLEANGFAYNNRHVKVESALCIGLRRYGVRWSDLAGAKFWRFNCDVIDTKEHYYTLRISTTLAPNTDSWYWHILSGTRVY